MPQSTPADRLTTITSHLTSANPSTAPPKMAPATRPPITCHILDTLTGLPAPNVPVTVTLLTPTPSTPISFTALTNSDGRVPGWTSSAPTTDMQTLFESYEQSQDLKWVARFDVEEYFAKAGVKPFFPEVEIRFLTQGFGPDARGEERGHWHVPLLLGPYSYTTYRGS